MEQLSIKHNRVPLQNEKLHPVAFPGNRGTEENYKRLPVNITTLYTLNTLAASNRANTLSSSKMQDHRYIHYLITLIVSSYYRETFTLQIGSVGQILYKFEIEHKSNLFIRERTAVNEIIQTPLIRRIHEKNYNSVCGMIVLPKSAGLKQESSSSQSLLYEQRVECRLL